MGRMTTAAQQWAHETEQALLDHMLRLAPAQGWTRRTLTQAGQALGMSEGETGLLVPHGPADLAACSRAATTSARWPRWATPTT